MVRPILRVWDFAASGIKDLMGLFSGHSTPLRRALLSLFALASLALAAASRAQTAETMPEPVSEAEFLTLFGLASEQAGTMLAYDPSSELTDKSKQRLPQLRPTPTTNGLITRSVLPEDFGWVERKALSEPILLLNGHEGQSDLSDLDCAVRRDDDHNLAFRCNAPIALNVPGGDTPSETFLAEMEEETGFTVGHHIWPGDKDALTGDRLMTARDIVTGMRFTLRYLNKRGFTVADARCSNRKSWRWIYVCLDDAKWHALTPRQKCEYVINNLLMVEGGAKDWSFAPLPAPGEEEGTLLSVGFTRDPREMATADDLCPEVAAHERVETRLEQFLQDAPRAVALERVPLHSAEDALLTLAAKISGAEVIVARLSSQKPDAVADAFSDLAELWLSRGGTRLCESPDCSGLIRIALPPLPTYRPPPILPPIPAQRWVAAPVLRPSQQVE